MHLSTEEPAASRMLEPFREVGGDVPECFSSRTHFAKIEDKKLLRKISSKNLTAGGFFNHIHISDFCCYINTIGGNNCAEYEHPRSKIK